MLPNFGDLLRRGFTVDGNKGSGNFDFFEFFGKSAESFFIEEDGVLVESSEEILEILLFLSAQLLEL